MDETNSRKIRARRLIVGYPVALIVLASAINLVVFGIEPLVVALPTPGALIALGLSALLLLLNHTWLMTATELTRARFGLATTPEERAGRSVTLREASNEAQDALARRHNAHRNTTENTVYFVFLALLLALVSPSPLSIQVWPLCFALARLGYSFAYLSRHTAARGLFMSLSLLSLYGMAGYVLLAALL